MITVTAFGLPPSDPCSEYFLSKTFLDDVVLMFDYMMQRTLFPLPLICWSWTPQYQSEVKMTPATRRCDEACAKVIDHKRKLLQNGAIPNAMIDYLLLRDESTSVALTDKELISNAKLFYLAGSDTTSIVITWIAFILATRPDIAARAREEATNVLFDDKKCLREDITLETMNRLTFCMAVARETLRLYK